MVPATHCETGCHYTQWYHRISAAWMAWTLAVLVVVQQRWEMAYQTIYFPYLRPFTLLVDFHMAFYAFGIQIKTKP